MLNKTTMLYSIDKEESFGIREYKLKLEMNKTKESIVGKLQYFFFNYNDSENLKEYF